MKDNELFHVIHKVPCGDTPYVKAKHAQVNIFKLWFIFICIRGYHHHTTCSYTLMYIRMEE